MPGMLSHKARFARRTVALASLGVVVFGVAVTSGEPQTAIAESVISQIGSTIDGEASGDDFGQSVALSADGSVFAVGAPYNGANRSHVRLRVERGGHTRRWNWQVETAGLGLGQRLGSGSVALMCSRWHCY